MAGKGVLWLKGCSNEVSPHLNESNSTISGHFDGIKSLTELSETFNGNEGDLSTSQSEMCDNCGIDR